MAKYLTPAQLEERLTEIATRVLRERGDDVLAVIKNGGDWQAALDSVYAQMTADLTAEFGPQLAAGVLDSALAVMEAERVAVDVATLGSRAATFAEQYSFDLIKGIEETTRERLSSAMSAYFQDETMDLKTLGQRVEWLFGGDRGQMIATTEATRASAQGQRVLVEELKDESPNANVAEFWQTSEDEIVCDTCGGLNGVAREEGGYHHPDGTVYDAPPAHPRCRCGTRIVVLQEGKRG